MDTFFAEQKKIVEMGIANWAERFRNFNGEHTSPRGYEIAADALRRVIRKYGEYHRNYGGCSYHRIVFKTPITRDESEFLGYKVEVRVTYWNDIMCFSADGTGIGSKYPWANELRLIMDRIEETLP